MVRCIFSALLAILCLSSQASQITSTTSALQSELSGEDVQWTEWEQIGTGNFREGLVNEFLNDVCSQISAENPGIASDFPILHRKCSDGSSQLRFANLFPNVDIDINVLDNGVFSCNSPTGILLHDNDGYDNLHLFLKGIYFESLHQIWISNLKWMVSDDSSYDYPTGFTIQLAPLPEVTFSLSGDTYLPSYRTEAKIKVTKSDNVAFYRVIKEGDLMPDEEMVKYMFLTPKGETAHEYFDLSSEEFSYTFNASRSDLRIIPFDKNGNPLSHGQYYGISRNIPIPGQWNKIGKGVFSDEVIDMRWGYDYGVNGNPDSPTKYISEVEVEALQDNPSFYRIKSPYNSTSHPLYEEFLKDGYVIDPEDELYFYFDATDPSDVLMPESYTLGASPGGYPKFNIVAWLGNHFGWCADNVIHATCGIYQYPSGPFLWKYAEYKLTLPGSIDYDYNIYGSKYGFLPWHVKFSDISPNVTEIRHTLINIYDIHNRVYLENYKQIFADDANGYHTYIPDGSSEAKYIYTRDEVPYGESILVTASVDAQGNLHEPKIYLDKSCIQYSSIDRWETLGTVTIKENILLNAITDSSESTIKAEMRCNPEHPYMYALINPYHNMEHPLMQQGALTADNDTHYIIINTMNPSRVFATSLNSRDYHLTLYWNLSTGISYENKSINLIALANAIKQNSKPIYGSDIDANDCYGEYKDGIINLDNCFGYYIPEEERMGIPDTPKFTIYLNSDGVESIEASNAGADAPVEYFNLQGIKVANPSGGIFIRRQGSSTTKIVIP